MSTKVNRSHNKKLLQSKIYTIRGLQVMLDSDLAEFYNVAVKRLNEQVKRNVDRFPKEFRFQITNNEYNALRSQSATLKEGKNLRSQIATSSSKHGGRRYQPYVFTEQGVAMLSTVLNSEQAIKMSVQIIKAFVSMRKLIANNALVFQRLEKVEQKQLATDVKLDQVFAAIEAKDIKPQQGIFFDGQVFDAYVFVSKLIKSAKRSIILVDNYIDESVLMLLSKRKSKCAATIYTKTISKKLQLDLKKHNEQYSPIEIKSFKNAHDRFLILDEKEIYHIGASLKDLGKKWFAFSKFDKRILDVLKRLR